MNVDTILRAFGLDTNVILAIFTASIITWIIFGIVIGIIAHFLDRAEVKGGILGSILTAILGSAAGGIIGNLIFGVTEAGVSGQSFLVALAGGVILVALERLFFRNREHIKTKVTRIK